MKETYPDGLDVEVITFKALEKAWKEAKLLSEREHVTPYIRKNPNLFKLANLKSKRDLSNKRWTLDTKEDYEFIKIIYKELYKRNPSFGMNEVINYLNANPEAERINSHINRNEGYLKSLAEDNEIKIEMGN